MIYPSQYLETFVKSKSFARPNLFSFEVFPPSELEISSTALELICLNCISAEIPGKSIDPQTNVDGGYIATNLPFNASYAPTTVTFRCSADLKEKRFFEEWQKLMYNETTNTLGWYDDYVGSMDISQLSRNGTVLAKYHMYEVWPSSVNPIAVNHDSTDAISEVQVSFVYRNYRLAK